MVRNPCRDRPLRQGARRLMIDNFSNSQDRTQVRRRDPRPAGELVMDPILIWGAGAIGGTIGAYLKRAGHDVTFVDVVPEHVEAVRTEGLRITGPIENFMVRVPSFTPDEVQGTWKRIFLAVKAHHTEAATRALAPHLA